MNVLIVGATGNVGRHTLDFALAENHEVTGFGRSLSKIDTESERLTKFKGDVTKPADVDAAVEGQDVVILTFGAPLTMDTILHEPDLTRKGTEIVIDAMQKHGVPKLICMTAIGAGDSKGHGRFVFRNIIEPVLLDRIMQDRTKQEAVVRASELPHWVIVRPTELTDGESAPIRVITDLENEAEPTTIARRDVGKFLAGLIGEDHYDHRTVLITNK